MGDSSRMGRMTMPQINQFTLFILTICALSAAALPSTQFLYEQQHKLYSDLVAPKLDKEWIDVNEFAQEAAERTFPEFLTAPRPWERLKLRSIRRRGLPGPLPSPLWQRKVRQLLALRAIRVFQHTHPCNEETSVLLTHRAFPRHRLTISSYISSYINSIHIGASHSHRCSSVHHICCRQGSGSLR